MNRYWMVGTLILLKHRDSQAYAVDELNVLVNLRGRGVGVSDEIPLSKVHTQ